MRQAAIDEAAAGARQREEVLLEAICLPAPAEELRATIQPLLTAPAPDWGTLLASAVEHKALCLLADTVATTGLDTEIPPALRRFLASVLRTSQHKAVIHRAEAAAIVEAAAHSHVAFAAVKGIALESALYGGRGAREFSDIDLLVEPGHGDALRRALRLLGYQPGHYDPIAHRIVPEAPSSATYTRLHDDLIVPCTVIDIRADLDGSSGLLSSGLAQRMLGRQRSQPLPGHPSVELPVLGVVDQLTLLVLSVRRRVQAGRRVPLRAYADAARLTAASARVDREPKTPASGVCSRPDDLRRQRGLGPVERPVISPPLEGSG
jgi:hypothetical protein